MIRLYIAGFVCPGICLIATGYVSCSASLAVFLIIAAVGLSGISFAGFSVNHLDLAPSYAGLYLSTSKFTFLFYFSCFMLNESTNLTA